MAEALHLDIPSASKLTEAWEFLCEAAILVSDVKSLLADGGNSAMAARLKDIEGRLADEIWAVERLINATSPTRDHLPTSEPRPTATLPR
jgi:hypothetical protein